MQSSASLSGKVLLSCSEFSSLTGLSPRTIAKLVASREVKSIRVGRRRLIPRIELDRFVARDHRITSASTLALKRRLKKSKSRKALKRLTTRGKYLHRANQKRKRIHKRGRALLKSKKKGLKIRDPRVARALGLMRREGIPASQAARRERMKLETFKKGAGKYLYRTGRGKRFRARSEDQLAFSMIVLTARGPENVIVRNSRERKLLYEYNLALRMFRAAEDGAAIKLRKFKGKTVGGRVLITDPNLLIKLDEADQIDAESFYAEIGGRS
jgi:excisionase family DNA binding protein